jgi:hypothetical protein
MANCDWVGNAAAIKDVWTITVANTWATSDTATVTIDGIDLVITIGSLVTTAQVATTIKEAFNGPTLTDTTATVSPSGGGVSIPQFAELTATVSGSVVTITANTAGVPHTISATESTAGSGTATGAHAITATGPNYWDNADNWAAGSVPVSTDAVRIDRPVSILYGLDQNAVTLASLTIGERFTGSSAYIGLPFRNANGYEEYRETYLKISATALTIRGASGRCKINVGTAQTAADIFTSGTANETGRAAIQFLGTHASNVLNVFGGTVGVADNDGEAATVATLRVTGGTVSCGTGATLTTVVKTGGTLTVRSSTTTLTNNAGTLNIYGGTQTLVHHMVGTLTVDGTTTITTLRQGGGTVTSGPNVTLTTVDKFAGTLTAAAGIGTLTSQGTTTVQSGNITTANIEGGTFYYQGTGTITALNAQNCTVDFSGTTAACTVTTYTRTGWPVTWKDLSSRVTVTNGYPAGGVIKYTAA